ncbi:MAG TPA: substrate binding domain-containing protein, partial [Rhizobacter sp.]|nr:substrate binding domain-containing protein [Rhizobacter sp.]
LTSDGALYQAQCQQALEQIAEAERALTGQQNQPTGLLRISLPTTYARYRLMALLPAFSQQHPQVELDVHIANRNIDFVAEGYDLAVRLGEPQDSRLIARKLEDASVGVFAAPAYLQARGTPRTLAELKQHDCIQFIRPSTGRPMPWIFHEDGAEVELTPRSRKRVLEDVLGSVEWARAGGGLVQTYHYVAGEAVRRGELVEVLKANAGRSRPFSILYPQNRHLSARVRAFVDFVTAHVQTTAKPRRRARG